MSSLAVATSHRPTTAPRRAHRAVTRREAPRTPARIAWAEGAGLVLAAGLILLALFVTSAHGVEPSASARVRVEAGQTLWTLAAEHPVAGLTTEQTAELIAQLNGIGSSTLAAGTSLRVPAQPAGDGAVAVAMR